MHWTPGSSVATPGEAFGAADVDRGATTPTGAVTSCAELETLVVVDVESVNPGHPTGAAVRQQKSFFMGDHPVSHFGRPASQSNSTTRGGVRQPTPAFRQQNFFFASDHVSATFSPAVTQEKPPSSPSVVVTVATGTVTTGTVTVVPAVVPSEQPMSKWSQQKWICASVMSGARNRWAAVSKACSQTMPPGARVSAGGAGG
mmetsp:Transcript_21476/g.56795  ORF Transcript_21476/g.56795 Transcript_21476/m.56795 type:complete len:201 (-) Transcript_21476:350-952(-)